METRDTLFTRGKGARRTAAGWVISGVLAVALLAAAGGMSRAQQAPEPPPPPDPPEPPQTFILNDGTPHLGVALSDVSEQQARELKLPAVAGAIVNHVQKDSPAARAGIQTGDAIVEFDGIRVRSSAELRRLIRETPQGRTVAIKLVRAGKSQVVSAKLEAAAEHSWSGMPEMEVHVPPISIPEFHFSMGRITLGISADDLTPQLAEYFGVKQGNGVLVSEVTKDGPADKAGLKAGDVIVQVDGRPVSNVDALRSALNENFTDDTRKVSLTIVRDRREQTLSAELSRSRLPEKTTSKTGNLIAPEAWAQQLQDLANQFGTQGMQFGDDLQSQKMQSQGEWQRQFQRQMRTLQQQLQQQMKEVRVALRQDGEI